VKEKQSEIAKIHIKYSDLIRSQPEGDLNVAPTSLSSWLALQASCRYTALTTTCYQPSTSGSLCAPTSYLCELAAPPPSEEWRHHHRQVPHPRCRSNDHTIIHQITSYI